MMEIVTGMENFIAIHKACLSCNEYEFAQFMGDLVFGVTNGGFPLMGKYRLVLDRKIEGTFLMTTPEALKEGGGR